MKCLGRALSVITLSLLGACSAEDAARWEHVGAAEDEILGGQLDTVDKGVVGLIRVAGQSFGQCSGSLLSPNVVLSALHCVAPTPQQIDCPTANVGPAYSASEFYVTTDTYISEQSGFYGVREVVVPPGTGFCGRDVSILILDQPISGAEATPYSPRDTPLMPNEIYSAAGYGEQGDGGPSGARMRRNDLSVLCVGGGCGAPEYVYPEEWVGDTGVCHGDSGGPAIDLENRITGVASRGAQGCEQPAYGDVYSHLGWIRDTTIYASNLAGIAPPPWTEEGSGGMGAGGGAGAAGGAGGEGPGPTGPGSTGSGWAAGDLADNDPSGEIVSSCALGAPADGARWPAWLALGLAAALLRRNRSRR